MQTHRDSVADCRILKDRRLDGAVERLPPAGIRLLTGSGLLRFIRHFGLAGLFRIGRFRER